MNDILRTQVPRLPRERFGLTFLLGSISFLLFVGAQVLAMNYAWFGLDSRNAAHNFHFNLTYFFPAILVSTVLALSSVLLYLRSLVAVNGGSGRLTVRKAAVILPTLPVLGQVMILMTQILAASLIPLFAKG